MLAGSALFYSTLTSGDSNSRVESRTVAFGGSCIKSSNLVRGQQARYLSARLLPLLVGSTTVSAPSVTSVHRRRRGGRQGCVRGNVAWPDEAVSRVQEGQDAEPHPPGHHGSPKFGGEANSKQEIQAPAPPT